MRVVLGIGNPGIQYQNTRHNIGFKIVDKIAERVKLQYWVARYQALIADVKMNSYDVLLVKPLTYVNQSGRCAKAIIEDRHLSPESLLVVVDDIALPFETLRIRYGGSSGSHRGLMSIIEFLNTDSFPRLRIGIGRGTKEDLASYVLSEFTSVEERTLPIVMESACEAVVTWIEEGLNATMNKFNKKIQVATSLPGEP